MLKLCSEKCEKEELRLCKQFQGNMWVS